MRTSKSFICVLLAFALAVFAFTGCGGGEVHEDDPVTTERPTETPCFSEEPTAQSTFRRATLYYISDEGYVVPVSKLIPWEAGIAKACLGYITSSEDNDAYASQMGLNTVIPQGVGIELHIDENGTAILNLLNMPDLGSAERERSFLAAVVNTLTEFQTVTSVTVKMDGEDADKMPNGTTLPKERKSYPLNVENEELLTSGSVSALQLYFPNESGALIVPVTRYVSGELTLYSAVSALMNGTELPNLRTCFPSGTLLLGAAIENGIVTVNFSEDFTQVAQTEGLYSAAYETLVLTVSELIDFERLVIQVNGAVFEPETPNLNEDIN